MENIYKRTMKAAMKRMYPSMSDEQKAKIIAEELFDRMKIMWKRLNSQSLEKNKV